MIEEQLCEAAPHWDNSVDLPEFLENIAAEIRRGDFRPCCEGVILTLDAERPTFITVCRWGENHGLLSHLNLKSIADLSAKQ